ncbi:MAG: AmmeMemoRadiSam system radical SAM enzyme [Candidatus Hodarchaeales archaeon]|jgi:pyruvate formate lyase activating enzyme
MTNYSGNTDSSNESWEFFRELKSGLIQCLACPRFCQLSDGEVGWCGARIRKKNKILPRTYGLISSLAIDPIEKKPLYHFYPNQGILSFGSHGCNLGCLNCQNHSIAMARDISNLRKISPAEIVEYAKTRNLNMIASTYNEPMIAYEFVRDIAELAHKQNMKMAVVDNGYISKNLATKLSTIIDAANIDIKGFSAEFYKEICGSPSWKPILRTCEIFKENNVHIEITNLIIPTKNDSQDMIQEMCEWIFNKLGPFVPLHFSRFHPDHKLRNIPATPISKLERAYKIAKDVGLSYVYLGNVREHEKNHTYCHKCGSMILQRFGYRTTIMNLKGNVCTKCSSSLPIIMKTL